MTRFTLIMIGLAMMVQLGAVVDGALTPSEQLFVDSTTAEGARENLHFYTSIDHMAGTPGDYNTVLYTQQQLEAFGFETDILPFQTLINYPKSRSLNLLGPQPYHALLSEAIYADDPTSDDYYRNLTFHGYGHDGNVTGELVYVNYGSFDDFNYLSQHGVDFQGKIAIVRYGQVFRGLKVQNAQLFGCIGCIIYSDPADDGYTRGAVYDLGPWRPETGVQRGSVQFLSRCAGDPGLTERDKNICGYTTEELIPQIPSLPISYQDALPLLQQIGGMALPFPSWQGGLNFTYNVGPGPATVNLQVVMNYTTTTLWNVVATIPGTSPDPAVAQQEVLLGNHRDAWVLGATDPNSGTAALLEVARGLSALIKTGWKPDRTIKLLSWDGEEYALLGSTNYAESNAEDIQSNVVAYINVDVAVVGSDFTVQASPSIASFIIDATKDIIDPNTNQSLASIWNPSGSISNVGILGSGSDFASFLHHLGISSASLEFEGPGGGIYHSVYDSFYWTTHFGDPTFAYHRCMAQLWGLIAIRLATSRVLPFKLPDYTSSLIQYETVAQNHAKSIGMQLDWTSLTNIIQALQPIGAVVECYRVSLAANTSVPEQELTVLNYNLAHIEQSFIITPADGFVGDGLPGRRWFKHIIQAPGLDTGYAADVFPSLADALDRNNATEAQLQIGLIAQKLNVVSGFLQSIAPYVPEGCTYDYPGAHQRPHHRHHGARPPL